MPSAARQAPEIAPIREIAPEIDHPEPSRTLSLVAEISIATLKDWLADPRVRLIDVREAAEHACEAIPQATLCPKSSFDPQQFPWDSTAIYVCHCRSGIRSQQVAAQLAQHYDTFVYNLTGGIEAWKAEGLPIHTSETLS